MPIVSIIVPVYNVEQYIVRCIESIQSQEMPEWELILVNDGSTDNSGAICARYANTDNRIRVVHKENEGVSSARNMGISEAKGEWVFFLDSDDALEPDFFNICTDSPSVSLIIKPVKTLYNGKETCCRKVKDKIVLRSQKAILKYYVNDRTNGLCDKIIKRNIIENNKLNESVKVGEDFLYSLSFIHKVESIFFSDEGSYLYFKREGSATTSLTPSDRINIIIQNISHIQEITRHNKMDSLGKNIILLSYLPLICRFSNHIKYNQKVFFKNIIKQTKNTKLEYLNVFSKIKVYLAKLYCYIVL